MTFISQAVRSARTITLPAYSGVRVMMMPFHIHDPAGSLPWSLIGNWVDTVRAICAPLPVEGVGYLTIDEALVPAGETHRRPGLHVDGIGEDGGLGGWGGGGGYAGQDGMLMVSSATGCAAWNQAFDGWPAPDGDCAHLADQLDGAARITMGAGELWWCAPLCVHEALPMVADTRRQFCRVSMPSKAPWHEGYTVNPLGVKPTGPIAPAREKHMGYRP